MVWNGMVFYGMVLNGMVCCGYHTLVWYGRLWQAVYPHHRKVEEGEEPRQGRRLEGCRVVLGKNLEFVLFF